MRVDTVALALELELIAGSGRGDREVTGGYASDLLSCVMGRARKGNIWITIQAHPNVVAVATLLELAAVVVAEDAAIEQDVIRKADQEGLPLLTTSHTTFWVVAELAKLGIKAQE